MNRPTRSTSGAGAGHEGASPPPRLKQRPSPGVRSGGGQAGPAISARRPRAENAASGAEQSNRVAEQMGLVPPVSLDADAFVDKLDARDPDYSSGATAAANYSSDEAG